MTTIASDLEAGLRQQLAAQAADAAGLREITREREQQLLADASTCAAAMQKSMSLKADLAAGVREQRALSSFLAAQFRAVAAGVR